MGDTGTEIFEKWGFGLAPPKRLVQQRREHAARHVLLILSKAIALPATQDDLDSLSEIKGLFSRVFRQDQWDWFTVTGQLGYPSGSIAKAISDSIAELRLALRDDDPNTVAQVASRLNRLPMQRCLSVLLGKAKIADEPGAGWIYILSTREIRDLLKIGMTTRTIEERTREINAATGIAVPFGVRSCWRVKNPMISEKLIHKNLAYARIRGDREFFRLDFLDARKLISETLRLADLEIRTLSNLSSLND